MANSSNGTVVVSMSLPLSSPNPIQMAVRQCVCVCKTNNASCGCCVLTFYRMKKSHNIKWLYNQTVRRFVIRHFICVIVWCALLHMQPAISQSLALEAFCYTVICLSTDRIEIFINFVFFFQIIVSTLLVWYIWTVNKKTTSVCWPYICYIGCTKRY